MSDDDLNGNGVQFSKISAEPLNVNREMRCEHEFFAEYLFASINRLNRCRKIVCSSCDIHELAMQSNEHRKFHICI